ncbi:glycosyltransferase family 4 protein [Beijerinckia sp. L45]|uniref:glycosyltransferase family 4 protein n=1 Tax=Beijerinckia sp. L45 TaxID=1641855 RepID=UPI00131D34FD|nr:glycosyltransferase family 4 protein [Beijerinckia sp. L45]
MRILHLVNHTGRFNGNVHAAVDIACAQAQLGHDVAVCSGGGDFDEVFRQANVRVFTYDKRRSVFALVKAIMRFSRLMGKWKPDVVHCHMVACAVLAYPACKWHRKPLVTTIHNAFERAAVLMGIGTRVIAVSAAVGKQMRSRGISSKRLRVVLNGTIGSLRYPERFPLLPVVQHPVVLYVGGLHPRKGVADLLKAFDILDQDGSGAHLYLVGEGPCEAEYKAQARAMDSAPRIHFCGANRDPRGFLQNADIFVLASHSDPAPLVLSEARENGCAIIATNVDGVPELLENGDAGLLVDAKSPEKLADAMKWLISDVTRLAEWRQRSQLNIGHLSLHRVARETVDVYRECLGSYHVEVKPGAPSFSLPTTHNSRSPWDRDLHVHNCADEPWP